MAKLTIPKPAKILSVAVSATPGGVVLTIRGQTYETCGMFCLEFLLDDRSVLQTLQEAAEAQRRHVAKHQRRLKKFDRRGWTSDIPIHERAIIVGCAQVGRIEAAIEYLLKSP